MNFEFHISDIEAISIAFTCSAVDRRRALGDKEKMELPSFVWIDCLGESRESHEIRLDVVIILGDY